MTSFPSSHARTTAMRHACVFTIASTWTPAVAAPSAAFAHVANASHIAASWQQYAKSSVSSWRAIRVAAAYGPGVWTSLRDVRFSDAGITKSSHVMRWSPLVSTSNHCAAVCERVSSGVQPRGHRVVIVRKSRGHYMMIPRMRSEAWPLSDTPHLAECVRERAVEREDTLGPAR